MGLVSVLNYITILLEVVVAVRLNTYTQMHLNRWENELTFGRVGGIDSYCLQSFSTVRQGYENVSKKWRGKKPIIFLLFYQFFSARTSYVLGLKRYILKIHFQFHFCIVCLRVYPFPCTVAAANKNEPNKEGAGWWWWVELCEDRGRSGGGGVPQRGQWHQSRPRVERRTGTRRRRHTRDAQASFSWHPGAPP